MAIQRGFAAYNEDHPDQPLRVRMGLHTGQAIRDADKFFGKTVIQASRIADRASGGEILASEDLVRLADGAELDLDAGHEVELKGLSGSYRLFGVQWAGRA